MNISNKNFGVSFTSKIVIDNIKNFYEKVYYNSKEAYSESISEGDSIGTLGLATCIGGGITNRNTCYVFHYSSPGKAQLCSIDEKIKILERENEKPGIFITGGYYPWYLSKIYFDRVMDKIKEYKDNTTIIWVQKNLESTSIHYDVKKDTWTLANYDADINSLEDLKKVYEIVKIADGDELWLGGKKVDFKG